MFYSKRILPTLVLALVLALPATVHAFCGFYVAGADTKLYNNATMVTLMREGTTTVLSMGNNYQGPPEDFAMVVPVPVVLQKEMVKTLPHEIFERLDKLAAPRLVEYWEQDPCTQMQKSEGWIGAGSGTGSGWGYGIGGGRGGQVVVEAQFEVGEYEIVILSAKDALGLETWITDNGYKIPKGAAPFLRPYVEQGSKFFVAKVNPKKVTFKDGMAKLSPLRFHYTDKDFRLPVRLGLINAKEKQDLIVHILAKDKRYEVANYPNVTIPTNLIVSDEVRSRFGEFYAALFDATTEKNPGAVVTEYSWDAGSCDPCPEPALTNEELMTLGLDVVAKVGTDDAPQPATVPGPPQLRIGKVTASEGLHKDIIRRYIRRKLPRLRHCYEKELLNSPKLSGTVVVKFAIKPDGVVSKPRASGLGNKKVESCMADGIQSVQFPKPKNAAVVTVRYPFTLTPGSLVPRRRPGWPAGWVLTRLHARYDRSSLGEDLVFKEAGAILGGVGGASDKLDKTAKESQYNNTFQGRYIIRHEWAGGIECKDPVRGVWGHPPADVKRDTGVLPATDLAFAARGKLSLASMVSEAVPSIALTPGEAPPEETSEEPATQVPQAPAEKKDKGCATAGGSTGAVSLLLALALLWVRRRRSV